MRSDWRFRTDGDRGVLSRSIFTLVAPYVPFLAFTILWYPLLGGVLTWFDWVPSTTTMGILFCVPIAAMIYFVPRLAAERRHIVLVRDDTTITLGRLAFPRVRLVEVVLLPHRTVVRRRHGIFLTFADGDTGRLIHLVSERSIEFSRGIAIELARWLDVSLSAAASAPPAAIVHPKD